MTAQICTSRGEILAGLKQTDLFDCVVIGGGIHGACAAHCAAASGLKLALLERGDYASGTSSRSSKMAHGGLRYLELFDFRQVLEGVKARDNLFAGCGQLVKPAEFLIPVREKHYFQRAKLGLGLWMYSSLFSKKSKGRGWISGKRFSENLFPLPPRTWGCYSYLDGLMLDTRLCLEFIFAARTTGALCLNYAAVEQIKSSTGKITEIYFTDTLSGEQKVLKTRAVLDCAGPWAGRLAGNGQGVLRYSRGSHLLFDKPWKGPCLFLPLEEKARYYFIWPFYGRTLVGTTEREVEEPESDPVPSADEVEEILERLDRDLPEAGLDRSSLYYGYSGIRSLPIRPGKARFRKTAEVSRRPIWCKTGAVFSLLGGKFTTAVPTAKEGVGCVLSLLGMPSKTWKEWNGFKTLDAFSQPPKIDQSLTSETRSRLESRYSLCLDRIVDCLDSQLELEHGVSSLEFKIGLDFEQAETLEDLMRRRVEFEYLPGHGIESLRALTPMLEARFGQAELTRQIGVYRARLEAVRRALGLR